MLAQIYRLRFEEDLTLREIAEFMGVGHQAIWRAMERIQRRILLEVGLDEVREKLAEDPGITEIEVEWIRL